jgi:hypothetical protein
MPAAKHAELVRVRTARWRCHHCSNERRQQHEQRSHVRVNRFTPAAQLSSTNKQTNDYVVKKNTHKKILFFEKKIRLVVVVVVSCKSCTAQGWV